MPTNDQPETLTGEQNAGVTIESYAGGPCWIVRDATGVESLLTADRTSAELRADRLRVMGGTWRTAEQLADMMRAARRTQNALFTEGADKIEELRQQRDRLAAQLASTEGFLRLCVEHGTNETELESAAEEIKAALEGSSK